MRVSPGPRFLIADEGRQTNRPKRCGCHIKGVTNFDIKRAHRLRTSSIDIIREMCQLIQAITLSSICMFILFANVTGVVCFSVQRDCTRFVNEIKLMHLRYMAPQFSPSILLKPSVSANSIKFKYTK